MTGQPYRLPAGGMIDRRRPVNFSFNGQRLTGFSGDTLASALLANGVHLVGRSFKYHRPRGILSAGTEEPNALVQLESGNRSVPNLKATRIELYEGLTATSVNCWPGVRFDAGAHHRCRPPAGSGRILLQDVHVAARRLAFLRAMDPADGGHGPRAHRAGPGPIRTDERALRRAGRRGGARGDGRRTG